MEYEQIVDQDKPPFVYQPEQEAQGHGVVILLVRPDQEEVAVLVGKSRLSNDRSNQGELKLPSEKREEKETRRAVLKRCLKEEVGPRVEIPKRLRAAWLGSAAYFRGLNA